MEFDLFKAKAPPLFGLDISSSSVKMLEIVDAGKGTYRVERYAIEDANTLTEQQGRDGKSGAQQATRWSGSSRSGGRAQQHEAPRARWRSVTPS